MRSKAGRGRRRSMGYERCCSKSIMIVFNLLQLLTLRINYLQLQIKQFIKCLWFYNSSVKFGQSVVYQTISTVIWPSIMTAIYQPVTAAIGPSIIAAIYETINTAIRPSIIAAVFYLFCSFYFGKSFSPIFDPACTSKSSSFLVKQANIKNIITGTHYIWICSFSLISSFRSTLEIICTVEIVPAYYLYSTIILPTIATTFFYEYSL